MTSSNGHTFIMGDILWRVVFVSPDSQELVDRTGHHTVATTDPSSHRVCLSNELRGSFLLRVLVHELGHCAMISYELISEIHRMVLPEHWIEAEEWCCNLLADYGLKVFSIAFETLGYDAWQAIPKELEKLVA